MNALNAFEAAYVKASTPDEHCTYRPSGGEEEFTDRESGGGLEISRTKEGYIWRGMTHEKRLVQKSMHAIQTHLVFQRQTSFSTRVKKLYAQRARFPNSRALERLLT